MQEIKRCLNCNKPTEIPISEMCSCTREEKQNACDEQYEQMQRHMSPQYTSIDECKRILKLNGYSCSKKRINQKKKKRNR